MINAAAVPGAQITPLCVTTPTDPSVPRKRQNGGSARGYQELLAPLAIPSTAEQAGGRAVCLCIASTGREHPLLPHSALHVSQIS
jgi:hypothetical protein